MGLFDTLTDTARRRLTFWRRTETPGDFGVSGCFTLPGAESDPGSATDPLDGACATDPAP